jgi:glycosyltransferase involved in cell wall biosynthesis
VIDDGSRDRTAAIAAEHGAIVLRMPHNVGIGSAVQTGFLYAVRRGYAVAVQHDGDGQHPADEVGALIRCMETRGADVVIGSRYLEDRGYSTPIDRRIGILILAGLITRIIGQPITDPTSGFRATRGAALAFCARDYPFDYPEPEAVVLLARAGFRVCETPVTMHQRFGGQSSITPLRSGYYMIKVILAILIGLLRRA